MQLKVKKVVLSFTTHLTRQFHMTQFDLSKALQWPNVANSPTYRLYTVTNYKEENDMRCSLHSIPTLFNPSLFIHCIELNEEPRFFFYVPRFSPLNPRFTENSPFLTNKK